VDNFYLETKGVTSKKGTYPLIHTPYYYYYYLSILKN